MSDLIPRLEAATEGSRELDLEMVNAVSEPQWRWLDQDREMITMDVHGYAAVDNPVCSLAEYTTSIDAAMTLIDRNRAMTIHKMASLSGESWAVYVAPRGEMQGYSRASLPLAICAAALRARAA